MRRQRESLGDVTVPSKELRLWLTCLKVERSRGFVGEELMQATLNSLALTGVVSSQDKCVALLHAVRRVFFFFIFFPTST